MEQEGMRIGGKVETPEFLRELLAEIDQTDPEMWQPTKARPAIDGKQVGTVSPYARKVFALFRFYSQETDIAKVKIDNDGNDDLVMVSEWHRLSDRADIYKEILWFLIKNENGLYAEQHMRHDLGIRQGWKVVQVEKPTDPLARLLEGLQ